MVAALTVVLLHQVMRLLVPVGGLLRRAARLIFDDHPLRVSTGPRRRAEHRRRHRTPDREQYSKQNKQPKPKSLHDISIALLGSG